MFCKYYRFNKDLNYPIFVKMVDEDLDNKLKPLLDDIGFNELDESEKAKLLKTPIDKIRVLDLSFAGGTSLQQIHSIRESDSFGSESIIPATGYRVYRHHNICLMVYSFGSSIWQLGVTENFGNDQFLSESRVVLTRFLSLALAKYGVIGFWGKVVDNGIVIMKSDESKGDALFVDTLNMKLLSSPGSVDIKPNFQIIRLQKNMAGKSMPMRKEELISFLLIHNSYLDYGGSNAVIRQVVSKISSFATATLYPIESFRDGRNLSL